MAISKNKKKSESTIYIGPTLPNGQLVQYTVFKGGEYMPHVADLVERSPSLRGLIVPVSELTKARADMNVQGNILHLHAANILKEFKN